MPQQSLPAFRSFHPKTVQPQIDSHAHLSAAIFVEESAFQCSIIVATAPSLGGKNVCHHFA
jgi:hypothetical protein